MPQRWLKNILFVTINVEGTQACVTVQILFGFRTEADRTAQSTIICGQTMSSGRRGISRVDFGEGSSKRARETDTGTSEIEERTGRRPTGRTGVRKRRRRSDRPRERGV